MYSDGVTAITAYGIYILEDTINSKYTAIPLTEEWLLKFGFRRLNKYAFVKKSFFIHHRKSGFNIKKSQPIKYVHELQNLYFYLTKDELKWL